MDEFVLYWVGIVIAAFVAGLAIGWSAGRRQGAKRARPDLDWHDFVRENAGYDFDLVRDKADEIVRLANEIGMSAKRAITNVRTLSPGKMKRRKLDQ